MWCLDLIICFIFFGVECLGNMQLNFLNILCLFVLSFYLFYFIIISNLWRKVCFILRVLVFLNIYLLFFSFLILILFSVCYRVINIMFVFFDYKLIYKVFKYIAIDDNFESIFIYILYKVCNNTNDMIIIPKQPNTIIAIIYG